MAEPPQLSDYNFITNKGERRAQDIGRAYVDTVNQMQMAAYNNDYNYWLWQAQQQYNSPAAQRQRLEEAGLNPNYQAIDAGNVSSIPSSNGRLSGNVGSNFNGSVSNAISGINAVVGGMSNLVKNLDTISRMPKDWKKYGQAVNDLIESQVGVNLSRQQGNDIENTWNSFIKGIGNLGEETMKDMALSPQFEYLENGIGLRELQMKKLQGYIDQLLPLEKEKILKITDYYQEQGKKVGYDNAFYEAIEELLTEPDLSLEGKEVGVFQMFEKFLGKASRLGEVWLKHKR